MLLNESTNQENVKITRPRRQWGKWIGLSALAGTLVANTAESVKDRVDNVLFQEDLRLDIAAYYNLANRRYGVEIDLPTADGETSDYRYVDSRNMLKWTIEVLALYPDGMIKDQLREISIGGTSAIAFGEASRNHIRIDLRNRFPRTVEERAFKSVMVHELQHFFDRYQIIETPDASAQFVDWQALNPAGATYDFADYSSSRYPLLTPCGESDGFVFGYQKKNPAEDRAVVAQLLFAPSVVEELTVNLDPNIQSKVEALRNFYFVQSGGRMDANFWHDYHRRDVDFFYWLKNGGLVENALVGPPAETP